jgi:acetyl/propionyl-CoA carboxylase alpha subunit
LPWSQEQLAQRGHAIELRVYAEDPLQRFLPQAGPLLLYREPVMPGVRVDSGFSEGDEISVHYDPLIAKLIAYGETRDAARRRALAALRSFPILGLRTNTNLLLELLEHPRFISGAVDTHLLDSEGDALRSRLMVEIPAEARAVAGAVSDTAFGPSPLVSDPWSSLRDTRL